MTDDDRTAAWEEFTSLWSGYLPTMSAFAAGYEAGRAWGERAARTNITDVLHGQAIGTDHANDSVTFHAPFWAIDQAFDPTVQEARHDPF